MFGQFVQVRLWMEPGLVPDHHMLGLGIPRRQPLQKQVAQLQADPGQTRKLSSVLSVHFQRAVEITPLVAGLIGGAGP